MPSQEAERTPRALHRGPGLVHSKRRDPDPMALRNAAAERDLLAAVLLGFVRHVPPQAFGAELVHELIAEAIEQGHRDLPAIHEALPAQWKPRGAQVLYQLDLELSPCQARDAATVVRTLWQMRKLLRAADRVEDIVAKRSDPFARVTWHDYVAGLRKLNEEVTTWTT